MKKCEEFAPLLSAYFDGELTEEESAAVRAHLSECEDCRARLDEYAQLTGEMLALGEEDVPEGFTARVMAAVRAEKAAKKPGAHGGGGCRWRPARRSSHSRRR